MHELIMAIGSYYCKTREADEIHIIFFYCILLSKHHYQHDMQFSFSHSSALGGILLQGL